MIKQNVSADPDFPLNAESRLDKNKVVFRVVSPDKKIIFFIKTQSGYGTYN